MIEAQNAGMACGGSRRRQVFFSTQ
jgi:hypothetical protein